MTEDTKMDLQSMDVAAEKRQQLKQLFPEVFSEDRVDIDALRRVLGDFVEGGKERFGLNWPGKAECMKVIQAPSVATLKPCRDESVNFDDTENLFIEGDNLEVLKLLQKSYFGKIKMIYIDPPYNTGNEFIYPDKYAENLDTYLAYTGQVDDVGVKFSTNTDSAGRYHSNWLNMMFPRLYLAKNLLAEDGFFVISLDDAEANNAKNILNEVFGEENHIATLVWDRNRKNDAKYFSVGHEYMHVYAKNESYLSEIGTILRTQKEGVDEVREQFRLLNKKHDGNWERVQSDLRAYFGTISKDDPKRPLTRYSKVDEKGPYRDDGNINWPGGGGPMYDIEHPITKKVCKKPTSGWRYPTKERFWEEVDSGKIVFGEDETTVPRVRSNLFDSAKQVMGSVQYSYAQTASVEFAKIFDGKRVFENPKNFKDMGTLIDYLTDENDIVLDFFAGSGSTAHGVIDINAANKTKRKYILVQLPEPCEETSEAFKAGYGKISDITKARVKLVGKQISNDAEKSFNFDTGFKLDLGFKAFSLDASNFKTWNGDAEAFDETGKQLEMHIDHVDEAASAEDILYELLLKAGFELTTKIETVEFAGKEVFSIAEGALLICLEKEITSDLIDAMAEADPFQVICLDEAFQGNDQLKTNAVQTFAARAAAQESEIVFRTV